jgi:glycosyltransferase involved in cell wall biosynthesis
MANRVSETSTDSESPRVSFVTPFFNTEKYLAECIESVLRQTYQNWDYVLVNNCSTDGSLRIAEKFAGQFPERIHIKHNTEFLSQVQNYNHAMRFISTGSRYCKVVQADDWLFPDCVKSMVAVAEAHPTVGIVAAYELEGDEVRLDGLPYPSTAVSGRDICRLYFLEGKYLFGTPTSLLLRSELVRSRDPFYDERLAPFEDGHACFDLLRTCDFGFVHQVLTFSRRDNESILSRARLFNLELLIRLTMLVAHGRDFLDAREFERCLKDAERNYLHYLAKCACVRHRKSQEFWEYHRNGLAAINYSLGWRLLGKWIPGALLEKALDTILSSWERVFD